MSGSRQDLVVVGVVLMLGMSACASPTAITATPAPTPTPLPSVTMTETPAPTPTPAPAPEPSFDKHALSIDDPASLWVVVNKLRPLNPADYRAPDLVEVPVPYVYAPQLRKEAADATVAMFSAFAAETSLGMQSQSAYRSYATQVSVYNGWVAQKGQAGADLTSARPGHSEHQTGLAIDISARPAACSLQACFANTPQGIWLAANAWRFGFVLRYPSGKTSITGYEFEPWHYRYVGVALATQIREEGSPTLEEFFGLPAAPSYAP